MLSGRYDFEDGGYYCGEYSDGLIEGHGVCVSPDGQGEFSGRWLGGFEISGVYKWPSGKTYEGCWSGQRKHGLGLETKDKWIYKGEWTRGLIGRYGCKCSLTSTACYEGTWSAGLVDGYGVEVSADGGIYRGQWFKGMRHGHGVRISVRYDQATHYRQAKHCQTFQHNLKSSLASIRSDEVNSERGGFVLRGLSSRQTSEDSDSLSLSLSATPEETRKSNFQKNIGSNFKRSLAKKFGKYKSQGRGDSNSSRSLPQSASGSPVRVVSGSVRSLISADSSKSAMTERTGSEVSFSTDIHDGNLIETYAGEWKSDKRCGYGIALRTDGLKYAGEWYNNKKNGYGMTTSEDGFVEGGKYKNNILVSVLTNRKTSSIFAIRSVRLRDQVDTAVTEAEKASQIAFQKTEVAVSRMNVAKAKAELASEAAKQARKDSEIAFQLSRKSWDNIISDSDLIDSIQLRHSQVESKSKKDGTKEQPSTGRDISLFKNVLNSSFRKSLRLSQRRENKHSNSHQSEEHETSTNEIDLYPPQPPPPPPPPPPQQQQQHQQQRPPLATTTTGELLRSVDVVGPEENARFLSDLAASLDHEAYNPRGRLAPSNPAPGKRNKPSVARHDDRMAEKLKQSFEPERTELLAPSSSSTSGTNAPIRWKESLTWYLLVAFNVLVAASILAFIRGSFV